MAAVASLLRFSGGHGLVRPELFSERDEKELVLRDRNLKPA
jgi:hypothetical protein